MASIGWTAFPRFKRFLPAREPHVFYTPQPKEITWASGQARSDSHLLAVMVRVGYFPRPDDVPEAVPAHIRRDSGLGEQVAAVHDSDRSAKAHRAHVKPPSPIRAGNPPMGGARTSRHSHDDQAFRSWA